MYVWLSLTAFALKVSGTVPSPQSTLVVVIDPSASDPVIEIVMDWPEVGVFVEGEKLTAGGRSVIVICEGVEEE